MPWQDKINLFDLEPELFFQSLEDSQCISIKNHIKPIINKKLKYPEKYEVTEKEDYVNNILLRDIIGIKTVEIMNKYLKVQANPIYLNDENTKSMYIRFAESLSIICNKQSDSEYSKETIGRMISGKSKLEEEFPEMKFIFSEALVYQKGEAMDKYWAQSNDAYIFKDKSISLSDLLDKIIGDVSKFIENLCQGKIPEAAINLLSAINNTINGPIELLNKSMRYAIESTMGLHDNIQANPNLDATIDFIWSTVSNFTSKGIRLGLDNFTKSKFIQSLGDITSGTKSKYSVPINIELTAINTGFTGLKKLVTNLDDPIKDNFNKGIKYFKFLHGYGKEIDLNKEDKMNYKYDKNSSQGLAPYDMTYNSIGAAESNSNGIKQTQSVDSIIVNPFIGIPKDPNNLLNEGSLEEMYLNNNKDNLDNIDEVIRLPHLESLSIPKEAVPYESIDEIILRIKGDCKPGMTKFNLGKLYENCAQ